MIPALIRKFHEARDRGLDRVECWGTGQPSREFLYVDDAADAILMAGERYNGAEPINIGTGSEITIRALAHLIAELTGFRGEIVWDASQPDGQPRRQLDVSRAADVLGWRARVGLADGLARTIEWWRNLQSTNVSLQSAAASD